MDQAARAANSPRRLHRLAATSACLVMAALALCCQARETSAQGLQAIKRVVLDPGHGGGNEGARGHGGSLEKDEVLKVAYAIRAQLEADYPELEVILTRTMDVDLDLTERCHVANTAGADLFISLHMNSAGNPSASGVEVFFLSADKAMPLVTGEGEGGWGQAFGYFPEGDGEAGGAEHQVAGDALATLMADLELGRAHRDSASLASALLSELMRVAGGRPNRGVRQANFGVLRGVRVPAVVVEFGFLSNAGEERWLTSKATRQRFGLAFSRALGRLDVELQRRKYLAATDQGAR